MKRKLKNREINFFTVSMLDLVTGALGSFLIITAIISPYYNQQRNPLKVVQNTNTDLGEVQAELEKISS